jgi:tripeptide aminopeptidase
MATEALDLFLELAAVPSPSGEERAVADRVLRYLHDLGLEATEDDTGPSIASTMGNIHVALEPTRDGEPLFFCAHLDTVPPVDAIEPVVEDGVVRNRLAAILGGDNKAAVVAMLEAVRCVLAEGRPHGGIELLFTSREETGLQGAYAFDHTRLRARTGYVYDQAEPVGGVILGAPSAVRLEVAFRGRASHAGMFPEDGRQAVAHDAVLHHRLDRVDGRDGVQVGTEEERLSVPGRLEGDVDVPHGRVDRGARVVLGRLEPEVVQVPEHAVGDGALLPRRAGNGCELQEEVEGLRCHGRPS